jgi:DNA polymerase-3 subunit epsilon
VRNVFIVDPGREIPPGAQAIHGISTEKARHEGCPLGEAAMTMHATLTKAQLDGVPIVAMNASFDITIATTLFRAFNLEPIEWRALIDPLVIDRKVDRYRSGNRRLDALCHVYEIELVNAHDAGGDADATVALARAIAARYPEIASYDIDTLTRSQVEWHRAWATENDAWRRSNAKRPLSPADFCWPLREVAIDPTPFAR